MTARPGGLLRWARRAWPARGPGRRASLTGAEPAPPDAGNAVVEFLGVALLLLVPTVYLVLVLGRLQAASFAVDGAAREAVRAVLAAPAWSADPARGPVDPEAAARAAAQVALADQGIRADPSAVTVSCTPSCTTPGSAVSAHVEVEVGLPGVPAAVQSTVPLAVPVGADASGVLDTFVAP